MTVKSTIEVDLKGSEAFQDYVKKVQQLNDIIGELPDEWAKVAKAMSLAVGAEASRSIATFDGKLEELRNQMVSLSQTTVGFSNSFRNAEVSAGNIFAAMRGTVGAVASLAKFGLGFAGGLASSIAGWSQWGLLGMLGLGRQVTSDQSRAYATNTSMGFQQAFFKNPGSIGQTMPGAEGFFQSVMEGEEGFSPMWAQLGLKRHGPGHTEEDFAAALMAAQRRLKAMPANMVKQRYGLLGIEGLSLEGANYLRNMSTEDLRRTLTSAQGAASASNKAVTDQDAVRWKHFVQDIENDFNALGNILKRELIPLQGPIHDLMHGFTDFAVQLGESGVVKKAIEAFANWLSHDAVSDLSWFEQMILKVANSMGDIGTQFHKLHEMFDSFFNSPIIKWIYEHTAYTASIDPKNYKGSPLGGAIDLGKIGDSATGQAIIGGAKDIYNSLSSGDYSGAAGKIGADADTLMQKIQKGMSSISGQKLEEEIKDAYAKITGGNTYGNISETIAGAESSFGKKLSGSLGAFGLTGGWRKTWQKLGDTDAMTSLRGVFSLLQHYNYNTQETLAAYTIGQRYVDDAIAKAGANGDWKTQLKNEPNYYKNIAGNRMYATGVGVPYVPYNQNITIVVPGMPGSDATVSGAGAAAASSAGQGRGW